MDGREKKQGVDAIRRKEEPNTTAVAHKLDGMGEPEMRVHLQQRFQ